MSNTSLNNEEKTRTTVNATNNPLKIKATALYPGMEEQAIVIDVKNNGELNIDLNYSIESIKMLGKNYQIKDPSRTIIGVKFLLSTKVLIVSCI